MNIPPKAGRLASGAYSEVSPIKGSPFPYVPVQQFSGPIEGGVSMIQDRTKTNYRNPLASLRPTALATDVAPITNAGFRPSNEPLIQPHERNSFKQERLASKVTRFGASTDKQADTPFNPQPKRVFPEPRPGSAVTGEKQNVASWGSFQNLWNDANNSFQRGVVSPVSGRVGLGRWDVIKKGVV
jgi:hypothetical protein